MTTILAAIDATSSALRVAETAAELARAMSGRLCLIHAFEPAPPADEDDAGREADELAEEAAALSRLHEIHRSLAGSGLEVQSCLRGGEAAPVVLAQARAVHAAWLVIGAHRRPRWRQRLGWHAGARIVRDAPCPVVVIPEPAAASLPEGYFAESSTPARADVPASPGPDSTGLGSAEETGVVSI